MLHSRPRRLGRPASIGRSIVENLLLMLDACGRVLSESSWLHEFAGVVLGGFAVRRGLPDTARSLLGLARRTGLLRPCLRSASARAFDIAQLQIGHAGGSCWRAVQYWRPK